MHPYYKNFYFDEITAEIEKNRDTFLSEYNIDTAWKLDPEEAADLQLTSLITAAQKYSLYELHKTISGQYIMVLFKHDNYKNPEGFKKINLILQNNCTTFIKFI